LSNHACRVQTAAMVTKIMLGLGQVLSKQPDVLRSKDLIEQAKKHPWLQVFSLNFGWIMPGEWYTPHNCTIDSVTRINDSYV
jgi:hypothetical protein